MSEIANRRNFLEAARILCTARNPNQQMMVEAITTLAQVLTDMSGEKVGLAIVPAAPHNQQQGE